MSLELILKLIKVEIFLSHYWQIVKSLVNFPIYDKTNLILVRYGKVETLTMKIDYT